VKPVPSVQDVGAELPNQKENGEYGVNKKLDLQWGRHRIMSEKTEDYCPIHGKEFDEECAYCVHIIRKNWSREED